MPPRRSSVASGEWHLSDPGTAAMGRTHVAGGIGRTHTVVSTLPAVAHALLAFNMSPEVSLSELQERLHPISPSCVAALADYIVQGGLATFVPNSPAPALRVAETAPRPRRVNLLSASWAMHQPVRSKTKEDSPHIAATSGESEAAAIVTTTDGADHAALEKQLQNSRQRTVEAAVVRLLKERRQCSVPELYADVSAALKDRFPVEARVFRSAVDVLVDREFVRRDAEATPPVLIYVA